MNASETEPLTFYGSTADICAAAGLMTLEREHRCEGVAGAAAIDVILNGEKPADPTQITGKFTSGNARLAADA